ncbi:MAG TPA: glycerophosphodiester phosphodiesterase family protein [Dermatophilaceae bacterium]|nr:glycerophosphodiester phosphodiesterase family protein [Dermatophilaceae bacterium]
MNSSPLVVGHRGASGYRPEHTLAAYELAARLGADAIEPDLVTTRDGVLVARHENELSATTDIAARPALARRRTAKVIDGRCVAGWFAEDLTLAELRTLRARERRPALRPGSAAYDGAFPVPTFAEVLDLRARLQRELGRPLLVYPEIKHPTFFRAAGLPLEQALVGQLRRAGLAGRSAPVIVQSFEPTSLLRLRHGLGFAGRLVLLSAASGAPFDLVSVGDDRTYADLLTPAGLRCLAATVDGIGPAKEQVLPTLPDGTLGAPTSLVGDAHAAGLMVHAHTVRAENAFLPPAYRVGTARSATGRAVEEQVRYLRAGVDGLFTDQPDVTAAARAVFQRGLRAA